MYYKCVKDDAHVKSTIVVSLLTKQEICFMLALILLRFHSSLEMRRLFLV